MLLYSLSSIDLSDKYFVWDTDDFVLELVNRDDIQKALDSGIPIRNKFDRVYVINGFCVSIITNVNRKYEVAIYFRAGALLVMCGDKILASFSNSILDTYMLVPTIDGIVLIIFRNDEDCYSIRNISYDKIFNCNSEYCSYTKELKSIVI